jgi:hypothetical protein
MYTTNPMNTRNTIFNNDLRSAIDLGSSTIGKFTANGEYISPTETNSEIEADLYICAGEYIKSINDQSNPVKLTTDTKLLYTANIHGTVNGCQLKILNKTISETNKLNKSTLKINKSIPVGYSKNYDYDTFSGQNDEVKSEKLADKLSKLGDNKLYVNNASFYINGFAITSSGLQEIILEPNTKLRIIKSNVSILDDDNKWIDIVPSNMVFKYTKTEYVEPSNLKPSNVEPTKPSNVEPTKPSNLKPSNVEPTKPSNVEPTKPSNVEPIKPSNVEPTKPYNVEPTKPSNVEPIKPSNVEPIKPSNVEPTKPSESDEFNISQKEVKNMLVDLSKIFLKNIFEHPNLKSLNEEHPDLFKILNKIPNNIAQNINTQKPFKSTEDRSSGNKTSENKTTENRTTENRTTENRTTEKNNRQQYNINNKRDLLNLLSTIQKKNITETDSDSETDSESTSDTYSYSNLDLNIDTDNEFKFKY